MATKVITVRIKDEPFEITLRSSKVEDGLLRGQLITKAVQMPDEEQIKKIAATVLFPTCICCVAEPKEIRAMSLDAFLADVDEQDMDAWIKAAYELNPHWQTIYQAPAADAEKKITTPSAG